LRKLTGGVSCSSLEGCISGLFSSDFLRSPSLSELLVRKALKDLIPTTSVVLGGINGFIVRAYCAIFTPLLKYIFDLILLGEHFPKHWKKVCIVTALKK
jgi:hypothetical protein